MPTFDNTNMNHMNGHIEVNEPMKKVNSNLTEATSDVAYRLEDSEVGILEMRGVEAAKDWVDNGSKL